MAAPIRPDSTGERIIAAATAEFSRYGIAGARVERIARAAKTSKERVYAYYRSKEALYRHVAAQQLTAVAEATRMDPTDLPGYAGRVHDYFTSHPEGFRLMTWGQMELAPDESPSEDPLQQSIGHKIEQLHRAQRSGHLDTAWDPLDILVLVNRIAMSWAAQPDLAPAAGAPRDAFLAARRAAIVAAVERLFPSTGSDSAS